MSQRKLGGEPFAVQPCQNTSETWLCFLTAVSQQEENLPGKNALRQVEQAFQARVVTPMHIFDDQEQRLMRRQACKEECEGLEEPAFLLFRVEIEARLQVRQERDKFGKQFDEFWGGRTQEDSNIIRATRGAESAQHIEERSIWDG